MGSWNVTSAPGSYPVPCNAQQVSLSVWMLRSVCLKHILGLNYHLSLGDSFCAPLAASRPGLTLGVLG